MEQSVNLYHELSKRERHHMMVPMPFKTSDGAEITLPMVALNGREKEEVKRKSEAEARASYGKDIPKVGEVSDYEERKKDNFIYWTVVYSVRCPENLNQQFFPDKKALFDCNITDGQAAILFESYMIVATSEPYWIHLDADDPDKIESIMQKIIAAGTQEPFFLSSLTSVSANVLISYLVARLVKLQSDNGSATTQPKDTLT